MSVEMKSTSHPLELHNEQLTTVWDILRIMTRKYSLVILNEKHMEIEIPTDLLYTDSFYIASYRLMWRIELI